MNHTAGGEHKAHRQNFCIFFTWWMAGSSFGCCEKFHQPLHYICTLGFDTVRLLERHCYRNVHCCVDPCSSYQRLDKTNAFSLSANAFDAAMHILLPTAWVVSSISHLAANVCKLAILVLSLTAAKRAAADQIQNDIISSLSLDVEISIPTFLQQRNSRHVISQQHHQPTVIFF
jgi:hypothetical protein